MRAWLQCLSQSAYCTICHAFKAPEGIRRGVPRTERNRVGQAIWFVTAFDDATAKRRNVAQKSNKLAPICHGRSFTVVKAWFFRPGLLRNRVHSVIEHWK